MRMKGILILSKVAVDKRELKKKAKIEKRDAKWKLDYEWMMAKEPKGKYQLNNLFANDTFIDNQGEEDKADKIKVKNFINKHQHIKQRYHKNLMNVFFISPCNLGRQGEDKSAKDKSAKGLPAEELLMGNEEVTEKTMALKDAANYGLRFIH